MTGRQTDFSESVSIELHIDEGTARTVERSLRVEADDLVDERSATRIKRDGGALCIDVQATDLVGLRAATNTWLGLLATAEETATLVQDRV